MTKNLRSLILQLLEANTRDSIILAKVLYGEIGNTEILVGNNYEFHFTKNRKQDRIYIFTASYQSRLQIRGMEVGYPLYMEEYGKIYVTPFRE